MIWVAEFGKSTSQGLFSIGVMKGLTYLDHLWGVFPALKASDCTLSSINNAKKPKSSRC